MLEDNIELEEEIVLSSAKPNISPQNILLAETLAEIGEAPTEPEIIEDEASREQRFITPLQGPSLLRNYILVSGLNSLARAILTACAASLHDSAEIAGAIFSLIALECALQSDLEANLKRN